MKKRAAIVILLAVVIFVFWRSKQATTVVVVEGVAIFDVEPGQYVEVFYFETDPDGQEIEKIIGKALLTKIDLLSERPQWCRFTLKLPSADASLPKGSAWVVILTRREERSRFAEFMDWLLTPFKDPFDSIKVHV